MPSSDDSFMPKPEIDGICFNDLWEVKDPATRRALCARGLIWETSLTYEGVLFAGTVFAKDRESAAEIADARGLGETIDGPYVEPPDGSLPLSETAKQLWAEIRNVAALKVPESLWPAAIELVNKDLILLSRAENGFRTARVWNQS